MEDGSVDYWWPSASTSGPQQDARTSSACAPPRSASSRAHVSCESPAVPCRRCDRFARRRAYASSESIRSARFAFMNGSARCRECKFRPPGTIVKPKAIVLLCEHGNFGSTKSTLIRLARATELRLVCELEDLAGARYADAGPPPDLEGLFVEERAARRRHSQNCPSRARLVSSCIGQCELWRRDD